MRPATVSRANWKDCQIAKSVGNLVARLEYVIEAAGAGKEYQVRDSGAASAKPKANAG
jgi:hypothetical protein